jgi:ATP-dependent exoDNAse (exonuclease V) alpha subunit
LPYTVKEDQPADKQKQQDALLYVGCPVIAFKNFSSKSKGEHTIHCVNNEAFTIKLINAESIVAVSKRAGEDGEPEEHTFTISTDEFHEFFLLNYCSTTHKQQGATIDNDIIIFDYEDMPRELKYTAVTRPKKLSQISIYK